MASLNQEWRGSACPSRCSFWHFRRRRRVNLRRKPYPVKVKLMGLDFVLAYQQHHYLATSRKARLLCWHARP